MDKVSENILLKNDFIRPSPNTTCCTHLHDLNYDCLREIFQYLDLAAQFAVIKSSKYFFNIILYDIWYPYYEDTFDILSDQSMAMRTKDFQTNFLGLILANFARIKGISSDIFQRYTKRTLIKEFSQIVSLSIHGQCRTKTESKCLDMREFSKFPFLQDLQLENVLIIFQHRIDNLPVRSLHLKNIKVLNDLEGEFLESLCSSKLEKLSIQLLPSAGLTLKYFAKISDCVKLKELTLSSHNLYDSRVWDTILNLPSLQVLTLDSTDNYYFSPKEHTVFYTLLKLFSESPYKTIRGLEINGVPEKSFYSCPYLQDVTSINWIVRKIFHRKLDGSVEWKSDVAQVIRSFYEFVVNNKNLKHLFVRDNIFHMKRLAKEVNFVEQLQEWRGRI